MSDGQLFAFENDFVASLRCIPMAVRLKLDRAQIKLSLRQWSRLSRDDRQELLDAPCGSRCEIDAYHAGLVDLIDRRACESAKPLAERPDPALWEGLGEPPPVVTRYASSVGVAPPTAGQWRSLTDLQRYALVKLTRDGHDNVNFIPAMREFGLMS